MWMPRINPSQPDQPPSSQFKLPGLGRTQEMGRPVEMDLTAPIKSVPIYTAAKRFSFVSKSFPTFLDGISSPAFMFSLFISVTPRNPELGAGLIIVCWLCLRRDWGGIDLTEQPQSFLVDYFLHIFCPFELTESLPWTSSFLVVVFLLFSFHSSTATTPLITVD